MVKESAVYRRYGCYWCKTVYLLRHELIEHLNKLYSKPFNWVKYKQCTFCGRELHDLTPSGGRFPKDSVMEAFNRGMRKVK